MFDGPQITLLLATIDGWGDRSPVDVEGDHYSERRTWTWPVLRDYWDNAKRP